SFLSPCVSPNSPIATPWIAGTIVSMRAITLLLKFHGNFRRNSSVKIASTLLLKFHGNFRRSTAKPGGG
ncbi:MAG: hypothetical protein IJE73_04840, partial [Muribaculaceae bacterium]|nr:hypothetical protein [Muribaculaceae bacterium]